MDIDWTAIAVVTPFVILIVGLIIGGISRKSDRRIREMPEMLEPR